jgi:predicted RNA-binding protein
MNMGGSSSNLATRTDDAAAQLNQMGLEYGQAYHSPSAVEDVSAWLNEYQLKLENGNGEMQSFTINTGDVDYEKAYAQEVESIGATVREEPSDYVWGVIDPNYLKQFDPDKATSTTGQGRGVKVVDYEYLAESDATYSLKDSNVPKPVSEWDPNVIEHPAIDAVTEVALLTSETLLDGGTKYFADLNINLYSELAKAADEGLHHQKIVTTGEIWENTLSNTAKIMIDDAKEKVEGFIQPFVNPEQYAKDQITGMVSEKVTSTITEKGVVKALTISGMPVTQDYKDNAGKTIYGTKTTGINIVNNAIKTLNYIDKVKEIHQNYKTRTEYMGK